MSKVHHAITPGLTSVKTGFGYISIEMETEHGVI